VATRFGNFELEAPLGQGGMADVFRARAVAGPLAGRTVALKRLREALVAKPEFLDLFLGEADVTRALDFPNIVKVLETGLVGEVPYIAMELIEGRDLGQILKRCKERGILLPVDFAIYVAKEVAQALDYAHSAKGPTGMPLKVVHCDVTPGNVFVSRLGAVKLGDFGVANAGAVERRDVSLVMGKLQYLAPEQLRGRPVSPVTDVFALGAVTYELLTGEKAFPASSVEEAVKLVDAAKVPPPSARRPEIPPAIDEVVLHSLRREPRERQDSAAAMAFELSQLYDPNVGTPLAIASVVRGLFPEDAASA
jgi:serine/threonine protein kinase